MQLPKRHATSLAGSRLTVGPGPWDLRRSPCDIRPFSAARHQARPLALDQAGQATGRLRLGRSPPAYGAGLRLPGKPRDYEFNEAPRGPAGRGVEAE